MKEPKSSYIFVLLLFFIMVFGFILVSSFCAIEILKLMTTLL